MARASACRFSFCACMNPRRLKPAPLKTQHAGAIPERSPARGPGCTPGCRYVAGQRKQKRLATSAPYSSLLQSSRARSLALHPPIKIRRRRGPGTAGDRGKFRSKRKRAPRGPASFSTCPLARRRRTAPSHRLRCRRTIRAALHPIPSGQTSPASRSEAARS